MPPGPANDRNNLLRSVDHLRGVTQRQRAGDIGGGDLALGMTDHRIGPHADRLPQLGQRHHDREQRRLHHVDPVHFAGAAGAPAQNLDQRPVDEFREGFPAGLDLSREYRCGVQQFGGPCPPTGSPDRGTRRRSCPRAPAVPRTTEASVGVTQPRGQLVQPGEQPIPVAADDHPTMLEGGAAGQRPPHIGDVELATGPQMIGQPCGLRTQR